MNGTGNDFVIFDARTQPLKLSSSQLRNIADRNNDVTKGCDQIIVMERSQQADVFMRIYNADGSEVNACGNATRCVAWHLMQDRKIQEVNIETKAGVLHCTKSSAINSIGLDPKKTDATIKVDMGPPRFIKQIEALLGFNIVFTADVGNPHIIFFTDNSEVLDRIDDIGPKLQDHGLFPKGVNVTIARINLSDNSVFSHVWERGVGPTASCGTAACATAISAIRYNPELYNELRITQYESGHLRVRWNGNDGDHIFLIGPVKKEFENEIGL